MRHYDRNAAISLAILGLTLVWLGLSATKEMFRAVEAIRNYLPAWFPLLNLVVAPLFMLVAALPRVSPMFTLLLYGVALASVSALYISYQQYPVAALIVVGVICLEAFWILPAVNARRRRLQSPGGAAAAPRRSSIFDWAAYVAIGLAVAAYLIHGVISRH